MNKLFETFSTLSTGRKISIVIVVVVSISALVALFIWVARADYQVRSMNLTKVDILELIEERRGEKRGYGRGDFFAGKKGGEPRMILSSNQLDFKRAVEKDYELRVRDMLSPVVGAGKVIVRVSAELDFKEVKTTKEIYDPESATIRSEELNIEKSVASSPEAALDGVAGRPKSRGLEPGQLGSEKKNESYSYEINKTISTTVKPSGSVKRLSVAVLIDGIRTVASVDDGTLISGYETRSEEELAKFTDLVKSAVGFAGERGDTLEVVNIPFDSELSKEAVKEQEFVSIYPELGILALFIRYAFLLIIFILVLFFLIRPLIMWIHSYGHFLNLQPEPHGAAVMGAERREGAGVAEVKLSPIAAAKENLKEIVANDPQSAANIIKFWLRGKETDGN